MKPAAHLKQKCLFSDLTFMHLGSNQVRRQALGAGRGSVTTVAAVASCQCRKRADDDAVNDNILTAAAAVVVVTIRRRATAIRNHGCTT
jgi:hypothetical protein